METRREFARPCGLPNNCSEPPARSSAQLREYRRGDRCAPARRRISSQHDWHVCRSGIGGDGFARHTRACESARAIEKHGRARPSRDGSDAAHAHSSEHMERSCARNIRLAAASQSTGVRCFDTIDTASAVNSRHVLVRRNNAVCGARFCLDFARRTSIAAPFLSTPRPVAAFAFS